MSILINQAYSEESLNSIISKLKELAQTYSKDLKDIDNIKKFFRKMHETHDAITMYVVMKHNIVTTFLMRPKDLNNYDKIYTVTITGKNNPELILTQLWSKT